VEVGKGHTEGRDLAPDVTELSVERRRDGGEDVSSFKRGAEDLRAACKGSNGCAEELHLVG
jgi:hypothetical protein